MTAPPKSWQCRHSDAADANEMHRLLAFKRTGQGRRRVPKDRSAQWPSCCCWRKCSKPAVEQRTAYFGYDLRPKPLRGFAASAMTLRVAINGFGRIGRNVLRGWISRGADTGLEIVGMNSTSDPATSAHLLTYDSILGRLDFPWTSRPRTPRCSSMAKRSSSSPIAIPSTAPEGVGR